MFTALLILLLQLQPVEGPLLDSIGARIEARLQSNEATDDTRYRGLRGLLEEIRDRPQADNTALFPRLNTAIDEIKALRADHEHSVGPIREGIQLLSKLVSGFIVLVVLSFAFSIYKQMTASKP